MKKRVCIGIAIVLAAFVLLNVPKRVWAWNLEHKLAVIDERLNACGQNDLACISRVGAELDRARAEIANPPWYVIGAGQQ